MTQQAIRVLIACEYSGRMREAFRAMGFDAYSCDLYEDAEDGSEHHFKGDAIEIGRYLPWDALIAHPPCTFLCGSGVHWVKRGRVEADGRPRAEHMLEALQFVRDLMALPIYHKAIENPVGIISKHIRKPDQIVQPWQFGDDASKKTCFWLENLPPLSPTRLVSPRYVCCGRVLDPALGRYGCPNCLGENKPATRWGNQTDSWQNNLGPSADRWKIRSTTYSGIATAAAQQWGMWINFFGASRAAAHQA